MEILTGHTDPDLASEFALEQLRGMLLARTSAILGNKQFLEQALKCVPGDLELGRQAM